MRIQERNGRVGALRRPDAAARRPYQITKIVIVIWILAVAVRLILINQPYVDHWSWRQSDVAAIAQNFLHNGFRFAYPQIDWAGNASGYVGTEFPILPFIAAVCYRFAGVHEWIGRIQAVILFAVSLPFFFLLVRETFGSTAAVWATFFYSFVPVNVFAGRSFMPDVPSLSLAIIGLYFFLVWVDNAEAAAFKERRLGQPSKFSSDGWEAVIPWILSAIAISLSLLIKITSIIIVAPMAYMAVAGIGNARFTRASFRIARDRRSPLQLLLFAAIAFVPSAIWYWHAHQIAQEFYPHHFFGAGGIRIENFSWYWHIARETSISSLTPVLSAMALIGLFVPQSRDRRHSRLFHWWLAAMILFVIVVGYGNRHRWYQLPLAPIAAAFAGASCAVVAPKISSRVVSITLSILLASAFAISVFWYVRPFYEPSAAQLRDAGLELNKTTQPNELIVAADMGDPTIFYYAERKGWHFLENDAIYNGNPDDGQQAINDLEGLRRRGATHFVFTRNTLWWLKSYPEFARYLTEDATLVEATREFRIYKLMPR